METEGQKGVTVNEITSMHFTKSTGTLDFLKYCSLCLHSKLTVNELLQDNWAFESFVYKIGPQSQPKHTVDSLPIHIFNKYK